MILEEINVQRLRTISKVVNQIHIWKQNWINPPSTWNPDLWMSAHPHPSKKYTMRLAFVIPWYGIHCKGGAEIECRGLVDGIRRQRPDIHIDVLTTCLKDFFSDWNHHFYQAGIHQEDVQVFRFPVLPCSRRKFDRLNHKLMNIPMEYLRKNSHRTSPITSKQEVFYIKHMVRSQEMTNFIKKNEPKYDFFIFMPYMFATTIDGINAVPHKSIVIPCLHDESYAYMNIYHQSLNAARCQLFHVPAEQRLAQRLYNLPLHKQFLLGEKVSTPKKLADPYIFQNEFDVDFPYILYSGRKISGKNLPLLIKWYLSSSLINHGIKLVLTGPGDSYQHLKNKGVIDVGFLSIPNLHSAMRGALCLCQPSINESFSIVLMEAWLQETPVLIYGECEVTRDHCIQSQGGLIFHDPKEFSAHILSLLHQPELRKKLGLNGSAYVRQNYTESKVIHSLVDFLLNLNKS